MSSPRVDCRDAAGFTLVEMLVAMLVMIVVTTSVFTLLDPVHGTFRSQPEVADMQQRLRVAVEAMTEDLAMAGSGTSSGTSAGPLTYHFPSVLPYRIGDVGDDASAGVFYRRDVISVIYVPPTAAQTTIAQPVPVNAQDVQVDAATNCPPAGPNDLCGFRAGTRAILYDESGARNGMTVTGVQAPTVQVQHAGPLTKPYGRGATFSEVVTRTYYLKADGATDTFQLMRYDGAQSDYPVVDNVVKLEFAYFGEPQPPLILPDKLLTDPIGPFTTYGPKPPPVAVDVADDIWPAGENCLFLVQDGTHVPRLPVLAAGDTDVELRPDLLRDGPWCVDALHGNRFDADLLRIRRIRVTVRVQAAPASMRGPAGVLFTHGGTSTGRGFVPDQEIRFDVTPRNLVIGR